MNRRAAVLSLVCAGLLLAGCGRRSSPKAPDGSTYNKEYPTRPGMGLPKDDPMRAPKPAEDDDAGDNDTPVPGAYSAPPPGLR